MTNPRNYTIVSNPMPSPLKEAMSDLLQCGATVRGAYCDEDGHHLVMAAGNITTHATLTLDHYADGVSWADGDLTWAVMTPTRTDVPESWREVCELMTRTP